MTDTAIRLGLRENAAQFTLLIVVNAFVGGMVGMERSILPAIAEQEQKFAADQRAKAPTPPSIRERRRQGVRAG